MLQLLSHKDLVFIKPDSYYPSWWPISENFSGIWSHQNTRILISHSIDVLATPVNCHCSHIIFRVFPRAQAEIEVKMKTFQNSWMAKRADCGTVRTIIDIAGFSVAREPNQATVSSLLAFNMCHLFGFLAGILCRIIALTLFLGHLLMWFFFFNYLSLLRHFPDRKMLYWCPRWQKVLFLFVDACGLGTLLSICP